MCFNCLRTDHKVNQCKSSSCRICGKWHHTLIHLEPSQHMEPEHHRHSSATNNGSGEQSQQSTTNTTSYCVFKRAPSKQILLSTALIKVKDNSGNLQTCRVLLDSGSQSCFISESCAQRLKLPRRPSRIPILGIGDSISETKHTIPIEINSCISSFNLSVDCLVLPKITENLPGHMINYSNWNLPTNIPLADPTFCLPNKIDILLGNEVCSYLFLSRKFTRDTNHPVLQETELGWVLSGRYEDAAPSTDTSQRPVTSCLARTDVEQLQKFWELEELHQTPRTREERQCDSTFQDAAEEKPKITCHLAATIQNDIIPRFSKLKKLQRIEPYCNRFVTNCRSSQLERSTSELSLKELKPSFASMHQGCTVSVILQRDSAVRESPASRQQEQIKKPELQIHNPIRPHSRSFPN